MKQAINYLIIIAAAAFAFFVVNETLTYMMEIKKYKEASYDNDLKVLDALITSQKNEVSTLAMMLANDSIIIEAYQKDNPKLLKEHLEDFWRTAKAEKLVYEMHFFKPPAESFVNFSNFQTIGKDVSDVRTDIEWVTTSFKKSSHILMCKSFSGLRGTHAIFDKKGAVIGGVSIGKKVDWIPGEVKKLTKDDSFIIYTKASTEPLVKQYYENFMKNKTVAGDYIIAESTLPVQKSLIDHIDFSQTTQDIEIDHRRYALNLFPLLDFNKNTMAYVGTLNELDSFYHQFLLQLFKSFLLILTTSVFVYFITKKRIATMMLQYFNYQKKASMGELIGIIAHQLKQPLNAISISKDLFEDEYQSGEMTEKSFDSFMNSLSKSITFMAASIDELRNFFRPNKQSKPFLVNDSIEKSLNLIATTISGEGIRIITEYKTDPTVNGIDTELQQVIINIVNNAKDVLSDTPPPDPFIKITTDVETKCAVIRIEDNGGGVPEKIIDKIFDPYFTTKGAKGTGIGLNLAKLIVEESMKGKIRLKNTDRGALFIIELPLIASDKSSV